MHNITNTSNKWIILVFRIGCGRTYNKYIKGKRVGDSQTLKEEYAMKKIKASFGQQDRIVCATNQGCHEFYYQPVGSKERILLFMTDEFSGSVFAYFRDNGRCMGGRGFSLTIKELYEDCKMYRNPKIGKIFDRLPGMIDYVLRENAEQKEQDKHNNKVKNADKIIYEDRELAA